MKKLVITNIDGYLYTVIFNNKEYKVNIEFYGLEISPNDTLIVSDKIFNTMTNDKVISFGLLDSKYGKGKEKLEDTDIIILQTTEKTIYLKQFFG